MSQIKLENRELEADLAFSPFPSRLLVPLFTRSSLDSDGLTVRILLFPSSTLALGYKLTSSPSFPFAPHQVS